MASLAALGLARVVTLIWSDGFDVAGLHDEAVGVAILGNRVFAVGGARLDDVQSLDSVFLVRAHDAQTGALLWEDRHDPVVGPHYASAVVAGAGRLIAVGWGARSAFDADLLVRAYAPRTGELLWQDRMGSEGLGDRALAVAIGGDRVFVAGVVNGDVVGGSFLVRAYRLSDGAVRWSSEFDQAGRTDEAVAVVTDGQRVIAAGRTDDTSGNVDMITRAYDAESGDLRWQDIHDEAGFFDAALDVALLGDRVFVTGYVSSADGDADFKVRTLDANTGAMLWEDSLDLDGQIDEASTVVAKGGKVFVGGYGGVGAGFVPVVRAYTARDGVLAWENRGRKSGFVNDIAVSRCGLMVGGVIEDRGADLDSAVRILAFGTGAVTDRIKWGRNGVRDEVISVATSGRRVAAGGFATRRAINGDFDLRLLRCS